MKMFEIDEPAKHEISPFDGIGSAALGTESMFTGLMNEYGISARSTGKHSNTQFIRSTGLSFINRFEVLGFKEKFSVF
jgi:hypothetical protein